MYNTEPALRLSRRTDPMCCSIASVISNLQFFLRFLARLFLEWGLIFSRNQSSVKHRRNLRVKRVRFSCALRGSTLRIRFNRHPQEWSISNFSRCSFNRNKTSHNIKNTVFHSLLRWKMIILPIPTTSLLLFSLKGREWVLFERGSERDDLFGWSEHGWWKFTASKFTRHNLCQAEPKRRREKNCALV